MDQTCYSSHICHYVQVTAQTGHKVSSSKPRTLPSLLLYSDFWCWLDRRYKVTEDKLHEADRKSPPSCYVPPLRATTMNHNGWSRSTYTTSQCLIAHFYVILLIHCALLVNSVWILYIILKPYSISNMTLIRFWEESTKRVLHCHHLQKFLNLDIPWFDRTKGWRRWITRVWGQWSTRNLSMVLNSKCGCSLSTTNHWDSFLRTVYNSLMSTIYLWPMEMLLTPSYCQDRVLTSCHSPPLLPHFTALLIHFGRNSHWYVVFARQVKDFFISRGDVLQARDNHIWASRNLIP